MCRWTAPVPGGRVLDGRALLRGTMRAADGEIGGADRQSTAVRGRMVNRAAHRCRPGALLGCRDQPDHLGHAFEEILWSLMVALVALGLGLSWGHMTADIRILSGIGMATGAGAGSPDAGRGRSHVPRAMATWEDERRPVSAGDGRLKDALQRRRMAHSWSEWRPEVPWMSLYFTAGVWVSFCLVFA
jgi:hypothetical protein